MKMQLFRTLLLALSLMAGCLPALAQGETYSAQLESKAKKGDLQAVLAVGRCYFYGTGVARDGKKAVKYLKIASDNEMPEGQYLYGLCYMRGDAVAHVRTNYIGGGNPYKEAFSRANGIYLMEQAAGQGFYPAIIDLTDIYFRGLYDRSASQEDRNTAYLRAYQQAPGNIELLEQKYAKGNLMAGIILGECYRNGHGVPRSTDNLYKYYSKNEDFLPAFVRGAECMLYGWGTAVNVREAKDRLKKAAHNAWSLGFHRLDYSGDPYASYLLGVIYLDRENDLYNGLEAFTRAAERGNAKAAYRVGQYFADGYGFVESTLHYYNEPKYPEAFSWFQKAAVQGNSNGQRALAECYYYGRGIGQDFAEALKWFKKAAQGGETDAQVQYGICCMLGDGCTPNADEARQWWQVAADNGNEAAKSLLAQGISASQLYARAEVGSKGAYAMMKEKADKGDSEAQLGIGLCNYFGYGVSINYPEAARNFKKAAESGVADAQYYYGACLDEFLDDHEGAVQWYEKAAGNNNPLAQLYMGNRYYDGKETEQDMAQAIEWFRKAAENNMPEAQYKLGRCYYEGIGVDKDPSKAIEWLRKVNDIKVNPPAYLQRVKYYLVLASAAVHGDTYRYLNEMLVAKKDNADELFTIGNYLKTGSNGFTQNRHAALACYEVASKQGHDKATAEYRELDSQLSQEARDAFFSWLGKALASGGGSWSESSSDHSSREESGIDPNGVEIPSYDMDDWEEVGYLNRMQCSDALAHKIAVARFRSPRLGLFITTRGNGTYRANNSGKEYETIKDAVAGAYVYNEYKLIRTIGLVGK